MDQIIKLAFGPRKMMAKDIQDEMGIDRSSISSVIRAYNFVGEGNVDYIAEKLACGSITKRAVLWAFDYYGKAVPDDLKARVAAKKRGDSFYPVPETAQEKTNDDNLVVLCDRLNALGRAVSDGLTEKTASVLAKEIAKAITESVAVATDVIMAEMAKQTEHLEKIAYNTKKLKKG